MLLELLKNLFLYSPDGEGGEPDAMSELAKELGATSSPETVDPKETTPETVDPKETTPETVDPKETTPETVDPKTDTKETNPMKQMREAFESEKQRAKELEEVKTQMETTQKELLRAIQLGIKGDTPEEILENLKAHDIKEEAGKTGLTEEQIKKDQELQERMSQLNQQEQETLFNRRAFDLQVKKNLTEEQILEFVGEAADLGINLLTTTTNFEKIYDRLNNPDSIKAIAEKDEEIARLKEELKSLKSGRAPQPGVSGGSESQNRTGDAALDALAKELT